MNKSAKIVFLVVASLTLICASMMLFGCGSSGGDSTPGAPTLASITVSPASAPTVTVGLTQQFTATALMTDTTATTIAISWSSSNAGIATISASGLATAVAPGTVTITATGGGKSGTASMTVVGLSYSGTFFMASEGGGHVGTYPFTINPYNTTSPITIDEANSHRIQMQGSTTSATSKVISHDVRLDSITNRLYYSSFMVSNPTVSNLATVGYIDVSQPITANKTSNGGNNASIEIDAPAAGTIAYALDNIGLLDAGNAPTTGGALKLVYCASGQNSSHFFPMSMSFPAYVDSIPKSMITNGNAITLGDIKRTYISQIDDSANLALWSGVTVTIKAGNGDILPLNALGVPPLAFLHGATSVDGTKMYLSTNVMQGLDTVNNTAGKFRTYILNTSDIVSGAVNTTKVLAKAEFTGLTPNAPKGGSVAYRASWTPDNSKILQAGSDRLMIFSYLSNALSLYVDTKNQTGAGTMGGGKTEVENHDVITTPDGKYAILAVRYADAVGQKQISGVQLYDIANKKFIGGVANTCGLASCHAGDTTMARPTCGIVGKFSN